MIKAFLTNTLVQDRSLLHSHEKAAVDTDVNVKPNKTESMCFKQKSVFSLGKTLILVQMFGSRMSSTKKDVNKHLAKVGTAFYRLSIIWKFDLTDKINWNSFNVWPCWYNCMDAPSRPLRKDWRKSYTSMLCAVLKEILWTAAYKQRLYSHFHPILQIILIRRRRRVKNFWRCK